MLMCVTPLHTAPIPLHNIAPLALQPASVADFGLFRVLGRGGFGVVHGCKKNNTGRLYAMKSMSKRRIKQKNAVDLCWNERIVLGKVDSPYIISLKYSFSSEEDLFLILDLATGTTVLTEWHMCVCVCSETIAALEGSQAATSGWLVSGMRCLHECRSVPLIMRLSLSYVLPCRW